MTDNDTSAAGGAPASIDTSVPHSARVWNYWLGGKDNYAADREAGDQFRQTWPQVATFARQGRGFLKRAVGYLAAEAGVRQFLDLGTGMPTAENTHEVAQSHAPDAEIVYVDNDPLVLAHAHALLVGTPEGRTDYIHADIREPEAIIAMARERLDFERPIALILMGVLGHVEADKVPGIVRTLVDALPSGSHLALWDGTDTDAEVLAALEEYNQNAPLAYRHRDPKWIAALFDGLEVVEPGLVPCPQWRPSGPTTASGWANPPSLAGVGRKP
ncbi:SAM-dependent methyltransferase [Streptomonospora sp. S1-112]|uniref:SAM-dependent methyltransferase n=1 Tax=Streptomonospora mangrovi TaxID=2883123 RepID=A0A9X3NIR4_9ACTN|nr:SAM-dependent methyltransferase [Streptomonospora mangrovi]MDA0564442.1 SAM-dependent methyltransferase [Streptomonospora mangrovi]